MDVNRNICAIAKLDSPECVAITDAVKKVTDEVGLDVGKNSFNQINTIIELLTEDNFRVALVGEFSRGKSSICNALIEQDALPVSDLPTTARITKVTYSEQNYMSYIGNNGQPVKSELSADFWDKIPAELSHDSMVLVGSNSFWLKSQNITILDTPGINDVERDALLMILSEIQRSDAVIVAVSALMAMSQTEKTFIEEHILTNRNPKVAIVITRLDDVKLPERQRVVDYVNKVLASIDKDIPIFCFRGYDNSLTNILSFEKLKALIFKWTSADIRSDVRLRSWGEFLKTHLASVLSAIQKQEMVLNEHDSVKRKELSAKALQVDKKTMIWEDAKIMARTMSAKSMDELDLALETNLEEMCDMLAIQLRNAPQPKKWYEEIFPLLARREFIRIGRNLENYVLKKLCSDYDVLCRQFAPHIPMSLVCTPGCAGATLGPNDALVLPVFELDDIAKKMMYRRVVIGAATAGTFLLFGPFGTLVSVGAGVANELLLMGSVSQQRQWLENQLRTKVLPEILEQRKQSISKLIDDLYIRMLNEINKIQSQWQEQQTEVLRKIGEPSSEDRQLLERFEEIKIRCGNIVKDIDNLITKETI